MSFLFLTVPPIVTLKSEFFVSREQTASLNCEVEGNPTPSVRWIPCDLPNIGCDKQYLNISKEQTSHANYTCTASNYLGNDSETTLLSKLQCSKWNLLAFRDVEMTSISLGL